MYLTFGKRLFDISFVIISSIILFPLILGAAILIKCFDNGPIIFFQKRTGYKGNLFYIYKFRTMPINSKNIPSHKLGDIHLNWTNKFLRRTNIDELPQLYNILVGDMSLVGPRPSLPDQSKLIKLRQKNGSLCCKPGLTGLAQICSFDGMSIYEKALLDLKYAQSITFKNDILIILKTFLYLRKKPPVY